MKTTVPRRTRRRNAAELAEDTADAVRIVVSELRKLLDPLGSRVLARRFGRLEQHAAALDKLAVELATTNGNGNGNGR